jgi:hypothetical protein
MVSIKSDYIIIAFLGLISYKISNCICIRVYTQRVLYLYFVNNIFIISCV